ncbi:MAG: serine hydrolase [Candidatus Hydrogenedentes bacterium]|nr:serine hydrolase [Candidatus Hydrogenedentota bacterium]
MRSLILLLVLPVAALAQIPESRTYDIPRLRNIVIDGDANDWGKNGFRVNLMTAVDGSALAPSDFDPTFRVGWDELGLLVLATVRDDSFVESTDENAYQQKDSVELLLSPSLGAEDLIHFAIAPGVATGEQGPKYKAFDWRKREPRDAVAIDVARAKINGGYAIEVRLPWSNLAIAPKAGVETALQVHINDADGNDPPFRAAWFPQTPAAGRTLAMYQLRLAGKPSAPVRAVARAHYDDFARAIVRVVTTNDWSGENAVVREKRRSLAEAPLKESNGRPRAEFRFDMPPAGETFGELTVRVGRSSAADVALPDARVWRAQKLMTYAPRFKPPVFSGDSFPACDYENPILAERYLGPYRIETTFYDAHYNKVTSAGKPGRYGAIIDIVPNEGRPLRRYATLYRQPAGFPVFSWWYLKPEGTVALPKELGVDHGALTAQQTSVGTFTQWLVQDAMTEDKDAAVVLAGLSETPNDSGPRGVYDDVFALDRQWWVGLKRKIGGTDTEHPNTFVCPYQKEGEPAATLRNGTPEEAKVKPESIDKIDAVLTSWVEESREPFSVCLVRNGVVFFERAYGERNGQPMTLDTKSWMASISKFLSGVSMMTLVDQGLVDLDAPLDRYLPQLRGIGVKAPLTVRHCFAHTNGLQLGIVPPRMFNDHYGDEMNDYEEVVAGYYPYLEVGTRHGYNGCGYAIAGKVIEQITGEALPQFFLKHMWGPLGCANTDEFDMSARTMSTPRDIATIAQMLLNKGAYGNMRFFKQETFEKFLPVKLAPYVTFPAENLEWGIGAVWTGEPGLSKQTYGHGAASAATLRIDPDNKLIIVMCRNTAGPKFGEFHPQFIRAIVDGLE